MRFPSNYTPRAGDVLFARVLLERAGNGIRAGIVTGAPGVGKTALAAAIAEAMGGAHILYQAHHWTSEEDMFVKIDPARVAALAGGLHDVKVADAYRPGALLRATASSHERFTVLVLDEWDKAPERADALLLDFLQSGIVRGPFGEEWRAETGRLAVVITSNGVRTLSEPLLRRCYRYEMPYLPPNVEADILRKQTGAKPGVIRLVCAMLKVVRERGESSPSLQEGRMLIEALALANGPDDVSLLIAGYITKTEGDRAALQKAIPNPGATLWGEVKRA